MRAAPKSALKVAGLLGLALMAIVACNAERGTPSQTDASIDEQSAAAAAVASLARFAEDRVLDDKRNPAAVLEFAGVEPGMRIFEIEAGRGYYTELLSNMVGADGEVIMQNPGAFDGFLAEPVTTRLAAGRLPNVRLSKSKFDALDAEDGAVDMVTWFLGPHELYFTPAGGESLGDAEAAYAEIFRILKPGGLFIVLDHAAAPGSPAGTGGTLHRIDPAIVKGLAEAAGFSLVDESNILRNPKDDYEMGVFDPKVRRQTDRFLLKYQKPE